MKVLASEFPFKGSDKQFVPVLKAEETLFKFLKRVGIIRDKSLAPNDGKINFNLIQPACVNRSMYEYQIWVTCLQSFGSFGTSMG